MTAPTQPRTITVLGATGNQGSGVVRALLAKNSPDKILFSVRAVTRDPDSPQAQRLLATYPEASTLSDLQLVASNVYDRASLKCAFSGVWGVFAVTNNRLPPGSNRMIETEEDLKHELTAGENIVAAAKDCGVRHFVFSFLPNIAEASGGRFRKVFQFDHKFQIEQLARRELPVVTALRPGLFYTNVQWPQYCRRNEDGVVRFCPPVPGDKTADWVDPSYDIGVYAAAFVSQHRIPTNRYGRNSCIRTGPRKTGSKIYPVVSPKIRFADFPAIFSSGRSQPAVYSPITLDEWGATVARTVGKGYEEDIRQMMGWIAFAPEDKICYGTMEPEEDTSWEDLGVRASTFEEWLGRARWDGP